MKPFIQGIILGFIIGVISAFILTFVAYAYLLFSFEELDLHDIPIERKKDESI